MQVLRAGFTYFALTFAAGFLFGILRTLWVVPMLGVRTAELLEMPLMLVVVVLAARSAIRRSAVQTRSDRLATGLVALGFLVAAELTLALGVQRLTLREYITSRDPVSGTAYLVMLVVFALMPLLLARGPRRP